jgi:hypothetical protein
MSEVLKFKGRLAEKEFELKEQELRIKGLIESIRSSLDPFDEIEFLDAELVRSMSFELADRKIKFIETQAEIRAIKKALGR